jgi:hypothetical protein
VLAALVLTLGLLMSLGGASAAGAISKTSVSVGYVTDFGTGSNDKSGPGAGSSIFVNALTGAAPEGKYTTADKAKTVTVTDMPVSKVDELGVAALAAFDTVIVFQVCDLGEHLKTIEALNTFLTGGGKVLISDGDRCFSTKAADYSKFLFPFATSSPGPQGASGSYTEIVASTLTEGLAVGVQAGDSVGDANIFTTSSGDWCASIRATNVLGANGFVEATARTGAGGLVIYEGEDFWFTFGPSVHLRQVFDDELKQNWAPDGLPCTIAASGITLSPEKQTKPSGGTATVTAKVTNSKGEAVLGVKVSFEVIEGPNKGQKGSSTTTSSGETSFTYPDTGGSGTDKLKASFTEGTTHESNTVEVIWEAKKEATCGNTNIGKTADQLVANRKRVNNSCTLPINASLTALYTYLTPTSHSGQQVLKGIVYADNKGKPGARRGVTEQLTFKSTDAAGWYKLSFTPPVKLSAGTYWIGIITGASSGVAAERWDSLANAEAYNTNSYTSGPSDPFGSFKKTNELMSLYVTYTEGSA